MNDTPLPGMPDPGPTPPKAAPQGARVTRSDNRHLCEECCRLIHVLGIIRAPYPSTARWRITTAKATSYLCHSHKEEWIND